MPLSGIPCGVMAGFQPLPWCQLCLMACFPLPADSSDKRPLCFSPVCPQHKTTDRHQNGHFTWAFITFQFSEQLPPAQCITEEDGAAQDLQVAVCSALMFVGVAHGEVHCSC